MKIYGGDISGMVLKCKYVANVLGLEYESIPVNLKGGEGQTAEYKQKHPAGKIPALEDGDFTLFESNAIIRYLAAKENSDLYPTDLKKRAKVDQWIDFASQHIGGAIGRVLFNKVMAPKFDLEVDEASMKCGYQFLERFLPIVDEQLGKNPYIAGDEISLADYTLLAHTDPLELAEIDVAQYPNLKKWRDNLTSQDFYQKIHKFYGEALMAGK